MSRIGKKAIAIPKGVEVKIEGRKVDVKGPKGKLSFVFPSGITADVADSSVSVKQEVEHRKLKASHGLTRAQINNMVIGVTDGFSKSLEIIGVGYKLKKGASAHEIEIDVGYSEPVHYKAPDDITFEVDEKNLRIIVRGADRQKVGQVAAEIRRIRPPEPYKGKGIRYVDEEIRRKVGKAKA